MSLKRDAWVLPRLRAQAVEPFLLAMAPHFRIAAQMDMRLRLDATGNLLVLLPMPSGIGQPQFESLQGRLAEAFEAAGRSGSELEGLPIQSRDLDGELSLTEGVLAYLWSRVQPAVSPVAPEPGAIRAVLEGVGETRAAAFAAIARRSRDVSFIAGGDAVTLMDFDDDPARGATLEGLRASGLPQGVTLMRNHSLAAMSVWLPEGMAFIPGDRAALSALLNGLADAGLLVRREDLHFVPRGDGAIGALAGSLNADEQQQEEPVPVDALAATTPGPELADASGPALRLHLVRLRTDAEAQQDLNVRLNDRRFPLGYRISLDVIRDRFATEDDIERLRAEIDEREARIALIQALGRPQLRLLRFSNEQLPAMVDGLRRMPRALREDAGLLYAASHAADRVGPAHLVLYNPERVQFDGVLPEFYWRAVAEDTPMSFWLDPHAEEARATNPDEPMVFVPNGQRILPYIDSFGSSLVGTLRLVLGNLFADASVVLDDPEAKPAFVFSSLAGVRDEIGVEIVDLARFAPLRLSLRWINDHILASSPRVADPDELRELAETLYAGQLARDMRKSMGDEVDSLRHEWRQAQAELLHCLDRLTEAVAAQVARTQQQFHTACRFLDMSRDRMAQITGSLNGLGTAISEVDGEAIAMAEEIPALAAGRMAFFRQYEAEVEAADRLMRDAAKEISGLEAKVAALRSELDLS